MKSESDHEREYKGEASQRDPSLPSGRPGFPCPLREEVRGRWGIDRLWARPIWVDMGMQHQLAAITARNLTLSANRVCRTCMHRPPTQGISRRCFRLTARPLCSSRGRPVSRMLETWHTHRRMRLYRQAGWTYAHATRPPKFGDRLYAGFPRPGSRIHGSGAYVAPMGDECKSS
jgi:hypothetical protein